MIEQTPTSNVTYYDKLAEQNNAKNLYKESLKLETQKILQEIEVDGIKMTTHLTVAWFLQAQGVNAC